MQQKILFLLACWYLFPGALISKANHAEPLCAAEAALPPCTLPAPANLQATQITPHTVKFTWDTVPGAVGYRGVLVNVTNGDQAVMVAGADNLIYSIIPGHTYQFYVAAMCSVDPPVYSLNVGQMSYSAPAIIIELIAKVYGCVPTGVPMYASNAPSAVVPNTWTPNQFYYFEFWKFVNVKPQQISYVKITRVAFRRTANGFEMGELDINEEPSVLCGPSSLPPANPCATAPANVPFAKFTFEDRTCRLSFALNGDLVYNFDAAANDIPFNYFRIFAGCNGEGGERSDLTFDPTGMQSMEYVTPEFTSVNPFSDQLTLFFTQTPNVPVKTRLLDLQGISKIQTVIQPDQLSENTWSLPTADLPAGLYFLQMETGPGQVVTQKVMKI